MNETNQLIEENEIGVATGDTLLLIFSTVVQFKPDGSDFLSIFCLTNTIWAAKLEMFPMSTSKIL